MSPKARCPCDPIDEALASLSLSRLPGVGAASFVRLVAEHGSPSLALSAYVPPSGSRKSPTPSGLSRARAMVEAGEGQLLWAGGPGYPASLLGLSEPPPVLFVRGELSSIHAPSVAIVGAREADEAGRQRARELGRQAARRGLVVVSGGARGIDAAAHRGALDEGGETVAVLGTGIDVVYPPGHDVLFDDIAAQGALVSELLPGAPPIASFFLTRNRLIAALARGLVLVQGDGKSGALTSARWARKLGRAVAVVPWGSSRLGEAPRQLAARGASVLSDDAAARAWLSGL